jgi:hypothetical protein
MAIDFCEDKRTRMDWIKVYILPSREPPADKMANGRAANVSDVGRGSSQTGAATAEVLSAAQSLSTQSQRLKSEVGTFLMTVRAA